MRFGIGFSINGWARKLVVLKQDIAWVKRCVSNQGGKAAYLGNLGKPFARGARIGNTVMRGIQLDAVEGACIVIKEFLSGSSNRIELADPVLRAPGRSAEKYLE